MSCAPSGQIRDTDELTRLRPEDIATIVKQCVEAAPRVSSPWMSAGEAADYIRCPLSRIRKLTSSGDLPHEHDGSRVLYHRDDLDQYIRQGGAITP